MKKIFTAVILIMCLVFGTACGGTDQTGPVETPSTEYTVTFVQPGYESVTRTVKEGEALTDIPKPQSVTGYTVTWEQKDFSSVNGNMTVNAVLTANSYTVTYDAGDGTVTPATQTVTYDAAYTLAQPDLDHYTFVCWKNGETAVALTGEAWKIADDVTLTAEWREDEKFTVSFVQTGYETIVKEVYVGETLSASDIPDPQPATGYTVAWDKTDDEIAALTETATVTAVKTANTYTITYETDIGTVQPSTQSVVFDSQYTLAVPEYDGVDKEFVCWKYNGEDVASSGKWTYATNVTFVAQWRDTPFQDFTLRFEQDGYDAIVFEIEAGDNMLESDIPEPQPVTGYDVSWSLSDAEIIALTSSRTITAVLTAKTYTITYDAGAGTVTPATQTVTYDSAYTLASPELKHYTFVCWKNGDTAVAATGTWNIADDVTLTAEWQEDPKFTVSFVQDGCETIEKEVYVGETLSASDIPEPQPVTGYTVTWDKTDDEIAALTASTTVTAVKTANTYTVTYDLGVVAGDSYAQITATTQDFEYGKPGALYTPTCEGYIFEGWVIEGTETPFDVSVWDYPDDVTLVAVWSEDTGSDRWWTDFY